MDHKTLCRSMLDLFDAIPSDASCVIVPTAQPGLIFVADRRPEVTTMELEGIAGQVGELVASECLHSRRIDDSSPLLGCLVLIPMGLDVDEEADRLRGMYHLATDPPNDEPGNAGPF